MTWQPIWDEVLSAPKWQRTYPNEELIRFVARNFYGRPTRSEIRILDLGCATGAGTWFLAREGFSVSAIDGSERAVGVARERLAKEGLSAEFRVGDFANLPFPDRSFDAIVDVAALMCNDAASTAAIVRSARSKLKEGGRFFSFTAADDCTPIVFSNMGDLRFSSRAEIAAIHAAFGHLVIDRHVRTFGGGEHIVSHWVVEAWD
jgi:SAM-dependent methyltransferase